MRNQKQGDISAKSWLTLLLLSVIWGSSFILIKKSLIALTPVQLACARISISGIAFLPFLIYYRNLFMWKDVKKYLIVGLSGMGLPAFFYAIAQTKLNSSMAGLINSLTPIFTLIIGIILFKSKFGFQKILGLLLSFIGVALLMFLNSTGGVSENNWYALLVIFGTISYGFSVNYVKQELVGVKSIVLSSASFTVIAIPAIIYLISSGAIPQILARPDYFISLTSIFTLSIFGTVIATIIFYDLVQKTNAVFSSSVAYLMPIVAIGWGVLDGEHLTLSYLYALVLILIGVYISRK